MLQFTMSQLNEKGERTDWQRVYYDTTCMGTDQLRGSAPVDDLRQKLGTSKGSVLTIEFCDVGGEREVNLNSPLNVTLDSENMPSGNPRKLQPGRVHDLCLGFLRFEIEVKNA